MRRPTSNQPAAQEADVWGDAPESAAAPTAAATAVPTAPTAPAAPRAAFDMEGLMTDFPTARDLERFVFDETGVVLNLKGRANRLKYQVALDVLNGQPVDSEFVGTENPYIDRADMVPTEDIKDPPARDPRLPSRDQVQNTFHTRQVPHPDPDYRAKGRRCDVTFRKYINGTISYEILGPIEPRPHGEKIDKFGRVRPEVIKWVDPRSGEQVVQMPDGTMSDTGRRLRGLMQMKRVNNSNFWDIWVDRDFTSLDRAAIANPWGDT